jgi:hypothetical protein
MSSTTLERPRTSVAPAPPVVPSATAGDRDPAQDLVDVWGMHSFPASDPPANW